MLDNTIKLEYFDLKTNKKEILEFSSSLLKDNINYKSLFVNTVDGKSMQPLISDRSLVVASLRFKEIEHEGIYILEYDKNIFIKQAKILNNKIIFVSINKDFSHLIYKSEDVRVFAKAVLTFTSL